MRGDGTGLPGSGKSVLARAATEALRAHGEPVKVLELDEAGFAYKDLAAVVDVLHFDISRES